MFVRISEGWKFGNSTRVLQVLLGSGWIAQCNFCYTVRVDFETKPSDAEKQRLQNCMRGFSAFMKRMRQDYLDRVAVEDAKFLRACGISAEGHAGIGKPTSER